MSGSTGGPFTITFSGSLAGVNVNTIGATGTVYVKVPAREQGAGKVLLTLQNRTVELEAVTPGEELPTGTQVVVSRMAGTEIVQVERLAEPGDSAASPRKDEVTHV